LNPSATGTSLAADDMAGRGGRPRPRRHRRRDLRFVSRLEERIAGHPANFAVVKDGARPIPERKRIGERGAAYRRRRDVRA